VCVAILYTPYIFCFGSCVLLMQTTAPESF
jgi:hypothetical protein